MAITYLSISLTYTATLFRNPAQPKPRGIIRIRIRTWDIWVGISRWYITIRSSPRQNITNLLAIFGPACPRRIHDRACEWITDERKARIHVPLENDPGEYCSVAKWIFDALADCH